jgi:hypothetical protein
LQEEGEHWDVSILRTEGKVMRLTVRKDKSPRDPVGFQRPNESVGIKVADLGICQLRSLAGRRRVELTMRPRRI